MVDHSCGEPFETANSAEADGAAAKHVTNRARLRISRATPPGRVRLRPRAHFGFQKDAREESLGSFHRLALENSPVGRGVKLDRLKFRVELFPGSLRAFRIFCLTHPGRLLQQLRQIRSV